MLPSPPLASTIRSGQRGNSPQSIVGADMVHQHRRHLGRIVLGNRQDGVQKRLTAAVAHKVQDRRGKGIIHHTVQLIPQQITPPLPIGKLGGGVLPHLADNDGVRVLAFYSPAQVVQEHIRQLIRHIQPPAADAAAHPTAKDAVLTANIVPIRWLLLTDLRQQANAPPGLVIVPILAKLVPAVIGAVRAVIGAHRGVMTVVIKILGIPPGMAEHAV